MFRRVTRQKVAAPLDFVLLPARWRSQNTDLSMTSLPLIPRGPNQGAPGAKREAVPDRT